MTETCPRCKNSTMQTPESQNALSRYDNKTYICSSCGIDEAMRDFRGMDVWPGYPQEIQR